LSLPEAENIGELPSPIPYHFVGDAAFPLKTYLLRPYPGKYLPENKHVFNYCLPGYVDHEDTAGNLVPGDWRLQSADAIQSIHRVGSNTYSPSTADLRDTLMNYFISPEGMVPWQINNK